MITLIKQTFEFEAIIFPFGKKDYMYKNHKNVDALKITEPKINFVMFKCAILCQ